MMNIITLGAEEELQIVDQHSLELVAHDFDLGQADYPDRGGSSSCELHKAVVELQTPICQTPDQIVASVASMREVIRLRAQAQGQRILSAGVHPFSDWKEQEINKDLQKHQHYIRLVDEYADAMRSMVSYGFHVHLGLPPGIPPMVIFNSLRNSLAAVLAISLSSPFYEGRDTGMQSWRHSMLDRLPRMGTPDIWESEAAYFDHIQLLRKVGTLEAQHGMWEDLRLHHRYHTLEVRICDATPSLEHIWLITALLQCEVATLVQDYQRGCLPKPLSRACLEENKWRVRRRGLAASLIDWHSETPVNMHDYFDLWLSRLTPVAEDLGLLQGLREKCQALFIQGASADIQRGIFQRSENYQTIVQHLIHETEAAQFAATQYVQ
ncbi:YbdK family carboxylate-amine ligase [Undibacterium seohonense]|uniref:Putative glutamate--cysteine ligase 2 n=1 Tax=Undibacterium seohonense TaxID=1344950 RepID=A0ABR6X9A0_9BURK|nr:YbdK family carboxylate-amine ligase [Undibacterium seohonense]MBC3809525.1 YbdK family carboxylate-amine ligase [Undibacterium seohonense]